MDEEGKAPWQGLSYKTGDTLQFEYDTTKKKLRIMNKHQLCEMDVGTHKRGKYAACIYLYSNGDWAELINKWSSWIIHKFKVLILNIYAQRNLNQSVSLLLSEIVSFTANAFPTHNCYVL